LNSLSKSERDVYDFVCKGFSNKEIAARLFVCEKTIKFHCTTIYKKLGVESRNVLLANEIKEAKNETQYEEGEPMDDKDKLPIHKYSQIEKVQFIDKQFKIGETVYQLQSMMKEVVKKEMTPATVNAACNCVSRLNETIEIAIQASRFLNER
jgi:DNA-binding CsgD family transcriptional regulator